MIDNVSNIPAPSAPMLLPNGVLSPAWWQFFVALYSRTGSAQGVDLDAIKLTIEALATENTGLTQKVADLTGQIADLTKQIDAVTEKAVTPAGYIHAQSSGVKRKIAYYEDK